MSCQINKTPPTYLVRLEEELKRGLGLSPVYNINTEVNPCIECFDNPTYWMSGATKPMSGLTMSSDSTHNLSEKDNVNLIFNFTGSTKYTGYTGEFCYRIDGKESSKPIPNNCVPFTTLSGNPTTLTKNFILSEISAVDNEYVITPWSTFYSECITNNRGVVGTKVDTSIYPTTINNNYFVTVVKPPTPLLTYTPVNVFNDMVFVNEVLGRPINEISSPSGPSLIYNVYQLSNVPVGGVCVIAVNGITMSNNDYTVDTDSRTVTINSVTMELEDIVTAYYNQTPLTEAVALPLEDFVKLEMFGVTGVTSGVTATTYNNFVNYNPISNRQEFFTKENIDTFVDPIVTINGVNLAYNMDVFKSSISGNKLVLREGLELVEGDVVGIYYYYSGHNGAGELGKLDTNTPYIRWSTQLNVLKNVPFGSSGLFTIEVTDRDDPDFNTILYTQTTVYNNTISEYTSTVGPITTTNITNYIYRVKFDKDYMTPYGNSYQTESYSSVGSFSLNWFKINNTIY
jgi:hypothetical protein